MGGLIGIGDLQKYADFIRSVPLSIVVTRSQAFPQPQVEFLVAKATLSPGRLRGDREAESSQPDRLDADCCHFEARRGH